MKAASGRAFTAPGAIAQMVWRVDNAQILVIGRRRVAETG